jgi:DNA ligase-1
MQNVELPILFGVSRTGKLKQWQAKAVEHDDHTASIIVESGYVGQKIRQSPKLIKKGKNIGKSNETTPFEQAKSEIESKLDVKRCDNYEFDLSLLDPQINKNGSSNAGLKYEPRLMLPQCASKMGMGKIIYPAYIQPKLNGVCDLAELSVDRDTKFETFHHSRGGHLFETLAHIDSWLKELDAPAPAHGELYFHGWSLQKIGSYTKKIKSDQHLLEYWLYDIAWVGPTFKERIEWLEENINKLGDCPIKFTPTSIVNNAEETKAFHDMYVEQGFEGGMLKNVNGIYLFQYNSNDLEKVKAYHSAEFEIVGGKEGVGTDDGCIIYRCLSKTGIEFDARPRGTVEDRKEMFLNLKNDISKMLTVRYAELSEDGVPLQPVGVPAEAEAVRDYE